MQQDDRAGYELLTYPLHHFIRRRILPVEAVDVPLYAVHGFVVQILYEIVVVFAVRSAEQGRAGACELLDGFVAVFDLVELFAGAQLSHMRMGRAVVADIVTSRGDLFDAVGVAVDPLLHEEEGAFHTIFIEDIQQGIGLLVAPRRVKGYGADLFLSIHVVYRDKALAVHRRDHLAGCG